MYKVFIIEDDIKLRSELMVFLEKYGYETAWTDNFSRAAEQALASGSQLVLLDVNLPVSDGFRICREIRAQSTLPVMIITSRDSEVDELMSINLGADDFITKPFNTQILLARMEALLRRAYSSGESRLLTINGVSLDTGSALVTKNNKSVELSKNELKILRLLMTRAGEIVSRDEIMDELWQGDEFVDDNTLTVNVNRLRARLKEIDAGDFLTTRRGQGYIV